MIIPAMKKTYKDQVALEISELQLPDSGFVAICGENGSGKSTFGKLLAGVILPDSKKTLKLEISGPTKNHKSEDSFKTEASNNSKTEAYILKEASSLKSRTVNYHTATIGYMTQKPFAFKLSVKNNLMLNADPARTHEENLAHADELEKSLGLLEIAGKNAQKLSGGQTQKMALARLLMKDYDVIILDEPTASMDTASTESAETLILEYQKKTNCLVLLITHSLNQASCLAESIITFKEGKII